MKGFFLYSLFLFLNIPLLLFSQCPTIDFEVSGSTCKEGNVILDNKSLNASNYEWDFCDGDLEGTPIGTSLITLSGSASYQTIVLVKDSSEWYGFTTGDNNKLYRLNFGSSIKNTPSYSDLGNISGVLNGPGKMKLIKEGSNWIGLVSNGGGATMVRLDFGSSLDNTPTGSLVLPNGSLTTPRDMEILYHEGSYIVLVNTGTNILKRLNFGNSLTNSPTVSQIVVTGASAILGISTARVCNKWIALITSFSNGRIYKLDFGTSLMSEPTITNLTLSGQTTNPNHVYIASDKGLFKAYVALRAGIIKELNFGNNFSTNTPTIRDLTGLGFTTNLLSYTMAYDSSVWIGMGMDLNSGKINKITFPNPCSTNKSVSKENDPVIQYSSEGTYNITLRGTDGNGNLSTLSKQVTITNSDAPTIETLREYECVSSVIGYSASVTNAQAVTNWLWDFNDPTSGVNNTSTEQNPSHQFSVPGVYKVKLVVTNDNGCTNTVIRNDTIYDSTTSSFSLPTGSLCSNQLLTFTNTSTGETEKDGIWKWDFLDNNNDIIGTSSQKDGLFTFPSGGNYTVRLTSGVNGCSSVASSPVTIIQGPVVDFSYTNNCRNSAVVFTDVSSGSDITGNTWEVRNSADVVIASTSDSPTFSHLFPADGGYKVSLIVSTGAGCNNYETKSITINSSPKVDFTVPSVTENVPTSFEGIDQSGGDDDVVDWIWDFGGERINGQNVNYAFPAAGLYDVKLIISTIQGCKDSITKSVTVNNSLCPIIDFEISGSTCKEGNIIIGNSSLNTSSNSWDFCDGDLEGLPVGTPLITLSGSSSYQALAFEKDGNNWFGFVTGDNNKLYRLNFEGSITNMPSYNDMGNISNVLNAPGKLKLIKEADKWIGLVSNGGGSTLVRLDFGSSLNNTPTGSLVLPNGSLTSPRDMEILYDKGSYIVLLNTGNNVLTRLNFGNSLSNTPTISQIVIPGASTVLGISTTKVCDSWIALITSFGNGGIYKLNFGSSLLANPTISSLTLSGPTTSPNHIFIAREKELYKAYVALREGVIKELNFGNNFDTNSPIIRDLTGLGFTTNLLSYTMAYDSSTWVGLGLDLNSGKIHKITFPNSCSAKLSISKDNEPIIKYSEPGTYNITLKGTDNNGNISSLSKQITIGNGEAPLLEATKQNECISSPIEYSATITNSQNITSWSWDFNDPGSGANNTSTAQNPTHQFSAPGPYKVKLVVTSDNGCTNTLIKQDTIYAETLPDFAAPSGLICSNLPIQFDTLFTGYTGSKVKWLWDFGDGETSTEKYPAHVYLAGGTYDVTLTAGVEGCSNSVTRQITVIQGPQTGFSFQSICIGETTVFTDTTKGDGLTSWAWDFGDGNTSSLQHPVNTYNVPGAYNVTLTVRNANGCEVSRTEEVHIYHNPVADFGYGLLCSGDSIEFFDKSTLADGNITNWTWQVYDAQDNLMDQKSGADKAKFLFSGGGTYTVSLIATSERGCSSIKTSEIEILPSPEVDIELEGLCAGDSVMLNGISEVEGQEIVAWRWIVDGGAFLEGQNVKYKFPAAGTYNISLVATSPNGCEAFVTGDYQIYKKPEVGFVVSNNCLNAPVQFTDTSKVEGDEIVSWAWNFGGLGTSDLQHPQFTFTSADSVNIILTVTTVHGCVSTKSQRIKIQHLPVADFSFDPEVGPPPFQVQFTNLSTGAVSYQWNFGNGDVSTEAEPLYVYNELGVFTAELIATNAFGCSDTTTQTIRVMPPVLNIVLENLVASTQTEELTFAVDVINTGSKIVREIAFIVDFGGKLDFKEQWTGNLNPEEKFTYSLTTRLVKDQLPKVLYLCIHGEEINSGSEGASNKVCIDLTEKFVVFDPVPNPARSEVVIAYLLPEKQTFEINFYNTMGQKTSFGPLTYEEGFNQSTLDLSLLSPGMYLVEFVYGGERVRKKLLVY
ncbi:MAG TPA: PKD domain-containing protein [Cytophagales bacterium]|nr:PKD domain-containing protein [Cytophagales bacterium]